MIVFHSTMCRLKKAIDATFFEVTIKTLIKGNTCFFSLGTVRFTGEFPQKARAFGVDLKIFGKRNVTRILKNLNPNDVNPRVILKKAYFRQKRVTAVKMYFKTLKFLALKIH